MLPHRGRQIGKRGVLPPAQLWVWGRGLNGDLGQNNIISRSSPVQVGTSAIWTSINGENVGWWATKLDGTVWGTGANTGNGQLGVNNNISRSSPIQLGMETVVWKFFQNKTGTVHAIKNDGTLWAWGSGSNGIIGNGTAINRSSPVQIGALTDWVRVNQGSFNAVAIKTDGTLWTWGDSGTGGALGLNNAISRSSPTQVGTLTDWSSAAITIDGVSSVSSMWAIKTDGTLWGWGTNTTGTLGFNDTVRRSSPAQIGALTNWSSISGVSGGALAIKTDGTLWAWGTGTNGILGLNHSLSRSSPTQVGSSTDWSKVAGGRYHTAAIKTDGTLWTWGRNTYGQLGHGGVIFRSSPTQVGALKNWIDVRTDGGNVTVALLLP